MDVLLNPAWVMIAAQVENRYYVYGSFDATYAELKAEIELIPPSLWDQFEAGPIMARAVPVVKGYSLNARLRTIGVAVGGSWVEAMNRLFEIWEATPGAPPCPGRMAVPQRLGP